ncbi:MAG TPA: site-specific integrase, partial [Candidatus Aminicenantes bacterium]|nr:site-specific integrase [Candidatus Aminicenantes bacterium]
LRGLFSLAVEEGFIAANPLRSFRFYVEDRQTRALSSTELREILAKLRAIQAAPAGEVQAILYDVVLVGAATGMRLSEVINLRWSWLHEGLASIPLSSTKHKRRVVSQDKKVKIVVLPPAALAVIDKHRTKSMGEFVFPMRRRDPRVISKAIIALRTKLGVPDFHYHQLRHTFSTALSAQSDLATASAALGHMDIKTTMRYSHPGLERQRELVTKTSTKLLGKVSK